jgi:RNA polymerase sigma factor (sigma-70 family)
VYWNVGPRPSEPGLWIMPELGLGITWSQVVEPRPGVDVRRAMPDAGRAMHSDAAMGHPQGELVPTALLGVASDQRLIGLVRAGSERAFEALFDRHHRSVLAFCRSMLGSEEEAKDAVQLTFLAAYRDLMGSARPIALRPWLYGIARYRCLDLLRLRRERPVATLPEPAIDRVAADLATREDLRAILADLARLPDDQRAALVLTALGDVSHDQIAEILGCRREKVKALVFQARAALIAGRAARETPCAEIREQLATLRGPALRRSPLRRHLHHCQSCRAFREEVRSQRRQLRALLPVVPISWLKRTVLGPLFAPGAGAGETALTAGALSTSGLAAAALAAVVIHTGGVVAAGTPSRSGREAALMAKPSNGAPWAAGPGATLATALRRQPRAQPARAQRSRRPVTTGVPTEGPAQGSRPPIATGAPGSGSAGAPAPEPAYQTESADQPGVATIPGQAAPAERPKTATPSAPPTTIANTRPATANKPPETNPQATPVAPPTAANPSEPPRANAQANPLTANHYNATALEPQRPANPPQPSRANPKADPPAPDRHATPPAPSREVAPARPTQAAQPRAGNREDGPTGRSNAAARSQPPGANGQADPANPAAPTKPPQADHQNSPPHSDQAATPPPPPRATAPADQANPAAPTKPQADHRVAPAMPRDQPNPALATTEAVSVSTANAQRSRPGPAAPGGSAPEQPRGG